MSALDKVLEVGGKFVFEQAYIDACAELAALRARVAELERERYAALSGHDYAVAEQAKSTAYITELLLDKVNLSLRIAELEAAQSATLTPRKCVTCQQAAEQMREDCAKFADDFDGEDLGFDVPTSIGACIRALPLPTCGDCNPLKPE